MRKFVLSIICLCALMTSGIAQIQKPQPRFSTSNLVPQDIAKNAARQMADEIVGGGPYELSEPIYCSDLEGVLNTYLFVVRKGYVRPNDEEILISTRLGRKHVNSLNSGTPVPELKAKINTLDLMDRLKSTNVPLYRPDGQLSGLYRKLEADEMMGMALDKKYGRDEYCAIYVSASFDWVPVPHIRKSLPPFYFVYEEAMAIAQSYFGNRTFHLTSYIFLGMAGEYFEVSEENSILIDARVVQRALNPEEAIHQKSEFTPIRESVSRSNFSGMHPEWAKYLKSR